MAAKWCLVLVLMSALMACGSDPSARKCAAASECVQNGVPGMCLASPSSSDRWCAFANTTCASGLSYGALAGDGLAKTCVAVGSDGGVDAGPDGSNDAAPVVDAAVTDASLPPTSCKEIRARNPSTPSGTQTIYPTPGGAAEQVYCDMEVSHDGGGWTVIFLQNTVADYNLPMTPDTTPTIGYDITNTDLRNNATDVLIGYRDGAGVMTDAAWAKFALPAAWKSASPFSYAGPGNEVQTQGLVVGGTPAPSQATLVFGFRAYGGTPGGCSASNWVATSNGGRICLVGAPEAPCFGSWARSSTSGGTDFCSKSLLPTTGCVSSDVCGAGRRFSIAVR